MIFSARSLPATGLLALVALTSTLGCATAQSEIAPEDEHRASTSSELTTSACGSGSGDALCRSALADTSEISAVVRSVLGVSAACTAGTATSVPYTSTYYYVAPLRCTLAAAPSGGAAATFTKTMQSRGYFGYQLAREGSVSVVMGQTSTQLCSAYTASACHDDQCRDQACRADLANVDDLSAVVATVLGVQASCVAGAANTVTYGASYYYYGSLRCELGSPPSASSAAAFTANMQARGYYGYQVITENGRKVVTAQTSTRICSEYDASCGGSADAACRADLANVSDLAAVVTSVLHVNASCSANGATRVSSGADYYYVAPLFCALQAAPAASAAATFTADMAARGYYGYYLGTEGNVAVVSAQTSTQLCSSYH